MRRLQIYFIVLLLHYSVSGVSQDMYPQLKSVFVFQFANNITWDKEQEIDTFRIGILGNDQELYQALQSVADISKLKKRQLEIIKLNGLKDIKNIQILYVTQSLNSKIDAIYTKIEKKNILLITEECTQPQYIMLNLVYKESTGNLNFEINKANLTIENFLIAPEMLLIGGTEIDVRELYQDLNHLLSKEKKIVDNQKTQIEKQTLRIEEQKALNEDILLETEEFKTYIEKRNEELNLLNTKIEQQSKVLRYKEKQIIDQEQQLENKHTETLNLWKNNIEDKTKELSNLLSEIEKQKSTINRQKSVLTNQKKHIRNQQKFIYSSIGFAVMIILFLVSVFRAYRIKKLANKNLEELVYNRTVKLQEEIEARNKYQIQLQKSETRFRSTFEQAAVGIMHIHLESGAFLMINNHCCEMLGYEEEKLSRMYYRELLHPDFLKKDMGIIAKFKKGEESKFTKESKLVTNFGMSLWFNITMSIVNEKHGTPSYLVAILVDITDQKNVESQLIRAKAKAEESDKLKSAFLANMSHELRTPMNGIIGFAGLLKNPDLEGDKVKSYVNIIEKGSIRLLNLINDLVNISKVEAGLMEVYIAETNILKLLDSILEFFKPETKEKGLEFDIVYMVPIDELIVYTDEEKIYAILINLVKNAIKYTHNGYINVSCSKNNEMIIIEVKDSGIGIENDRQNAVFERFVQADILDQGAYQGAGLGLAITKSYIEMLGGNIWLESNVNEGSSFFISIHNHQRAEISQHKLKYTY